jgi:hypothetical protein
MRDSRRNGTRRALWLRCGVRPNASGGEAQGESTAALGEAAVTGKGAYLAEAGLFILPMPKGSDGDLLFEEGAGFGGGGSPGLMPFPSRHPLDGRPLDKPHMPNS